MSNLAQFVNTAAVSMAAAGILSACAQTGPVQEAVVTSTSTAQAAGALAVYPAQPEEPGVGPGGQAIHYRRYVIDLPPLSSEEDARRVELIAGRVMTVDCNRQGLGGSFASRDVSGWGYPYWVFQSAGPERGFSTRMACLTERERDGERQAFVSAPSVFVRYDSRLPLVVYLPEDFALRWRVWQAGDQQSAKQR